MKVRTGNSTLLILGLLFVSGCAKMSSPSGGPRDTTPPVALKSFPENGTRNFTGKEIIITFDEYVTLENINEKFMVSPPMQERPQVVIRGKDVRVRYDEDLRENTTYTFNFLDAIRDLNEGNPIDNFQFVFSTGPVIDSLSVTGNVRNALSLDIPENTIVMLHRNPDDTAVLEGIPDYITRVEKNGNFRINNISAGTYSLYALKDLDNSKNFNLADEEFAFLDSVIQVSPETNYDLPGSISASAPRDSVARGDSTVSSGMYSMILFPSEKKNRYLTSSARPSQYRMSFTLSLPPDTMGFGFSIPGSDDDEYFVERSTAGDTINVWLTDTALYSQEAIRTLVTYPFTDSLGTGTYRTDTVTGRFVRPRQARGGTAARQAYRVSSPLSAGSLKPGQRIRFTSPTPLAVTDTSKLTIFEIVDDRKIRIPYSLIPDSLNSCITYMDIALRQGGNYIFSSDSAAFRSIYGEASDSTGGRFSVRTPEAYGQLAMNITNHTGQRIIQLLDRQEKIVKEVIMKEDGLIEFPLLEKGFYRLRTIYDLNGDGKWTTGDFKTGRQPEPVSYYGSEIEIKTNWQITQDWDLGIRNVKPATMIRQGSPTGSVPGRIG